MKQFIALTFFTLSVTASAQAGARICVGNFSQVTLSTGIYQADQIVSYIGNQKPWAGNQGYACNDVLGDGDYQLSVGSAELGQPRLACTLNQVKADEWIDVTTDNKGSLVCQSHSDLEQSAPPPVLAVATPATVPLKSFFIEVINQTHADLTVGGVALLGSDTQFMSGGDTPKAYEMLSQQESTSYLLGFASGGSGYSLGGIVSFLGYGNRPLVLSFLTTGEKTNCTIQDNDKMTGTVTQDMSQPGTPRCMFVIENK